MMKIIKIGILLLAALLLSWLLPWCYAFVTASPSHSPFTLYSCVTHSFASLTFDEKGRAGGRDFNGNNYTQREFDSILPTFYYRQLASEGRFPAEIEGMAVSVRDVERSKFMFRTTPSEVNCRKPAIYQLLESMPGRVDLKSPDDVFRITATGIEFVDMETNRINPEKSETFTRVMRDKGFVFPARVVAGNASTRKEYDNGYLLADDNHRIFHLKQLRGRPFVRRTEIPDTLQVGHIFVTEFSDRRLLGFLSGKDSRLYTLDTEYVLRELPIGTFDPEQEELVVIGDMFYWTVTVGGLASERLVAVNPRDYSRVDEYSPESAPEPWHSYAGYVFPFELSFTSPLDGYVKPRIGEVSFHAFGLGLLLAALYAFLYRRSLGKRLWQCAGIVVLGLFLFIPLLILRPEEG